MIVSRMQYETVRFPWVTVSRIRIYIDHASIGFVYMHGVLGAK
jgi:hypothetical protein